MDSGDLSSSWIDVGSVPLPPPVGEAAAAMPPPPPPPLSPVNRALTASVDLLREYNVVSPVPSDVTRTESRLGIIVGTPQLSPAGSRWPSPAPSQAVLQAITVTRLGSAAKIVDTERQHPLESAKSVAQPAEPPHELPAGVVQLVCLSAADTDAAEGAEPDAAPPPRGKSPQPLPRSRFTLPIFILSALLGTYVVAMGVGYFLGRSTCQIFRISRFVA